MLLPPFFCTQNLYKPYSIWYNILVRKQNTVNIAKLNIQPGGQNVIIREERSQEVWRNEQGVQVQDQNGHRPIKL